MAYKFLPMLLLLNTCDFLYRRRKFSKGPPRWLGAKAVALRGESGQPRLAGEEVALGIKTERGTGHQEKLSPHMDRQTGG